MNKVNPKHYRVGGIDTFDYMKAKLTPTELAGFCKANVIKYILRADHKDKLNDLRKGAWYLNRLIYEIEKGQGKPRTMTQVMCAIDSMTQTKDDADKILTDISQLIAQLNAVKEAIEHDDYDKGVEIANPKRKGDL